MTVGEMLRLFVERSAWRLGGGVRCLSEKASQGVSFTRGDGTAPRFYKEVNIGPVQGKVWH